MKIRELMSALQNFDDPEKEVSILIIDEEDINVDIDEVKKDDSSGEAFICVNAG
jgi:hypothetical protein